MRGSLLLQHHWLVDASTIMFDRIGSVMLVQAHFFLAVLRSRNKITELPEKRKTEEIPEGFRDTWTEGIILI